MLEQKIKNAIRDVPDFPKKGILFKDITPLFQHPDLCKEVIDAFSAKVGKLNIDAVAGIESRGFMMGFALAQKLNVPFVLIRKSGKLPYQTIAYEYTLEYGSAKIEMHVNDIKPNWNVLIHDDLLATGGTAFAAAELIKMQKGTIAGFAFILGLNFLNGKEKLKIHSKNSITLAEY